METKYSGINAMKKNIIILSFLSGLLGAVAFAEAPRLFRWLGTLYSNIGRQIYNFPQRDIDNNTLDLEETEEAAVFFEGQNNALSFNSATAFTDDGVFEENKLSEPIAGNNYYPDLSLAAQKSKDCVVFIRTTSEDFSLDWFFGIINSHERISSGSGVIFFENGNIVTNNHVVADASIIEVVYKKRTYAARIVGTDPSSDLAVIKIDANNLSAIERGDSDNVKVGDWVLAVGNPFNLTSTVTAGIVSAKGRNINILKEKFPIESFIQTDAAINPGNSGGALVDIHGKLIGINTAILSQTGAYSGYSFAVPVNIVRKVVKDIIKHGKVQKAFMHAFIMDITEDIEQRLNLNSLNGVLIEHVQNDGACDKAGLKSDDIIIEMNSRPINNKTDLETLIAYASPGDSISVVFIRGNQKRTATLVLLNENHNTDIINSALYYSVYLKSDLEPISTQDKRRYGISTGIKVKRPGNGVLKNLPKDFIIYSVNGQSIKTPRQLENTIKSIRGRIQIKGITPSGKVMIFDS